MGDPVTRVSGRRVEASNQFVFALCARLKTFESVLDAVIDGVVVADLKVQAVVVTVTAPVAPVKRLFIDKIERSSDIFPIFLCNK